MGLQTTQQRSFTAYAYAWLPPLRPDGFSSKGARTISVKFTVSDASGTLVQDQSVAVSLVDANGNVVVGPMTFGNTPDSSVAITGHFYHTNLPTAGVPAGQYRVRVQFDSAGLVGEFSLAATVI